MVVTENWGIPPQSWIDYAKRTWTGKDRLEKIYDDASERLEFVELAHRAFEGQGFQVKSMRTWINIEVPVEGGGLSDGYPHTHKNSDGLMLIHFIEPGDKPAPLVIFDGGEIVQTVYPEAGLTAFVPDGVSHGAMRNNGTTDRIALMALALP